MRSLVLRLEGPLQAWGVQSKLGIRATDREPSKSGVLGLLGAALGMERDDDAQLARLCRLQMAVRVDRPGTILRDFHTAGGGSFRGSPRYFVHGTSNCVPTTRYYLQDASFTVALSGDDDELTRLEAAMRSPRWPLFLGRRSCPMSTPPVLGLVDGGAAEAITSAYLQSHDARRNEATHLRLVTDTAPSATDAEPRYDLPLSFREGARRYGKRYVRTSWLDVGPAPMQTVEVAI